MSEVILALDTSSGTRVALVRDGVVRSARVHADARAHAEHATTLVQEVLEEAGLRPADVTAVAVGTGPAPFTGLRVGLVTAEMLSLSLGVPAWGVPSLDAWAAGALAADPALEEVVVATDARRREVYTATYVRDAGAAGGLRRDGDFAVHRPSAEPTAAVGSGTVLYPEAYPALQPGADLEVHHLATLGSARVAAGLSVPLTPLYLRRPDVHGAPGGLEPAVAATAATAPEPR
ncbi:tRNA (adenosine(37)-N6)-threonylcarbamoyltransferase complex dimerization subunit type 1 TsaB [Litorihabitans aurantiacus]|uniref:tRNA (Adenosine(37)-N6)-threonylcarbamoyltransferase complex dimerization subunit type 1 TsaB n=1 Tax=Litorihabitans aurantiacus TaxID=1930061 RepID=A0AA37XFI9_9MICO|nr:tRNA (adenosine(37)-N6)-threonylcarbamoyltransferase complex dimerization subunit type 1 TsaB [Litorihabitans aurantiacus]GMA32254.1 tRNA (adenosine(37)-N6)-threonylcarbamoyltransferase complex dimerization subunit type 1 TsaB [Litorihabitans aurantiacus]